MPNEYKEESKETNLYDEMTSQEDNFETGEEENIPEFDEESDQTNADDEGGEGEAEEEQEEEQEEEFYSPEQITELSRSGEYIDPEKLKPEFREYQKTLQADYTRKTQDLADALRGLQQPQQMTPEQAIQQGNLDYAFNSLQEQYDELEDLIQDATMEFDSDKVKELRKHKKQVKARITQLQRNINSVQQQIDPELLNNSQAILKAVKKETGVDFNMNELASLAAQNPQLAAKVGKILAVRHRKQSARQSASKKERQRKPNELLQSSGSGKSGETLSAEEQKLKRAYEKAEKTGDSLSYLKTKLGI